MDCSDNGSFSNLPQPSGSDIDALQATIMYMAQYEDFQIIIRLYLTL